MTLPLIAARDAIVAAWNANWTGTEPVLWHQNTTVNTTPGIDTPNWLYVEIGRRREEIEAYGAGPRALERCLTGIVTLRAFTVTGAGEDDVLALLDRAVAALRGVRQPNLAFFGDISYSAALPSEDGLWTFHSAYLGWEYRFVG